MTSDVTNKKLFFALAECDECGGQWQVLVNVHPLFLEGVCQICEEPLSFSSVGPIEDEDFWVMGLVELPRDWLADVNWWEDPSQ